MKIYLLLIVGILMFGTMSCQMSEEQKTAFNANATRMDFLIDQGETLRDQLKDGQIDAAKIEAISQALQASYVEIDQLIAANKALSEETGTPEIILQLETIAASLLGVRFMRGGASKGAFSSIPLVGSRTSP